MSDSAANLSVRVCDEFVCIRISGRANFQSSVDFRTLVTTLWQQGHNRFVLDLTNCHLMDSTFLGVLAGLGTRFGGEPNGFGPATLELYNPSPRITEMLDNLGIKHLFKTVAAPPDATPLTPVQTPTATGLTDRTEVTRTCLEAHRLLMDINPANVRKFKEVARFLEEDLKKRAS